MIRVFAIDPGPQVSGYCVWDGEKIEDAGVRENEWLRRVLAGTTDYIAIEAIVPHTKMGKSVIDTCFEVGRFVQIASQVREPALIPRAAVKQYLLGTTAGTDADVIYVLAQRFGAKGTKKAPGLTYGLKSHAWQAFALAVYVYDSLKQGEK